MKREDRRCQVASERRCGVGWGIREKYREGRSWSKCASRRRKKRLPNLAPRWRAQQLNEGLAGGAGIEESVASTQNEAISPRQLPRKSQPRFIAILSLIIDGRISTSFDDSGWDCST